MNLSELRYLVAVADHRHFGRAAKACYVTQPTLSTQIKKLESELGLELIERSPNNIMLTETGRRVVERARIILRESESIQDIARRAQDPESGTLRIGMFPTLGPYLLPHVVPHIRDRFPRLELLLVEEKTEELLRRLHDGRLDAAILALPVNDERLHQQYLFDEDFVLAVPSNHPLAQHDGAVSTGVIAGNSLLLLEEGHCLRDQALAVCELSGASERDGFRATSLETLRQMVSAGVGITLLPQLAVAPPVAANPDVHLLPFEPPVPRRRIAMFWRSTNGYGDFLVDLAAYFADLPAGLVTRRP